MAPKTNYTPEEKVNILHGWIQSEMTRPEYSNFIGVLPRTMHKWSIKAMKLAESSEISTKQELDKKFPNLDVAALQDAHLAPRRGLGQKLERELVIAYSNSEEKNISDYAKAHNNSEDVKEGKAPQVSISNLRYYVKAAQNRFKADPETAQKEYPGINLAKLNIRKAERLTAQEVEQEIISQSTGNSLLGAQAAQTLPHGLQHHTPEEWEKVMKKAEQEIINRSTGNSLLGAQAAQTLPLGLRYDPLSPRAPRQQPPPVTPSPVHTEAWTKKTPSPSRHR